MMRETLITKSKTQRDYKNAMVKFAHNQADPTWPVKATTDAGFPAAPDGSKP
jgi:hypothetical protein